MSYDELVKPPVFTASFSMLTIFLWTITGKLRDFLKYFIRGRKSLGVSKGYCSIRDPKEEFYIQRMYGRISDCYNRPIASAPDAWFDVMLRENVTGTTGQSEYQPTGETKHCLNLASYNYLGFAASDPYCTPRVLTSVQQLGVSTCASRVQGGNTELHAEMEALVARYLDVEAALTYGMGFATNSSTIPALVGKGDLIFSDALNHASIVSGARLSGAKIKVFRHNDAKHLEALLRQSIAEGQPRTHRPWKKVLVIVEGIYSMEGEACNLKEIVEVAKRYKAYVYLDEAHSIGALGKTGRGVCEHAGVNPRDIDVMMGTFTKSFGSCGGYIAGKRELVDYMRRHSPAHLYACSMAPGCVQQVISAMQVIMGLDGTDRGRKKIEQLHDNANFVRKRLLDMGLSVLGSWDSPVAPIMTYHNMKKTMFSRETLKRGLGCVVVGFPATPLLMTRARLCISAAHSREDLEWALQVIEECADLTMIKFHNKVLLQHVAKELQVFMKLPGTSASSPTSFVRSISSDAESPLLCLAERAAGQTAKGKASSNISSASSASSSGSSPKSGSGDDTRTVKDGKRIAQPPADSSAALAKGGSAGKKAGAGGKAASFKADATAVVAAESPAVAKTSLRSWPLRNGATALPAAVAAM